MADRGRVLVVEDEPLSRDMLVRRLTKRGFRVDAVADGESCLASLAQSVPDIVLLDVNLPGLSGLEVLGRLRQQWSQDALPVILVTARGEPEHVVSGLEAGANDYVVKPVDLPILLARMLVCLRAKEGIERLVEAERQRVMIRTLGESCHQLAQPMTAITVTLEMLIQRLKDQPADVRGDSASVLAWITEVSGVIHKMQSVASFKPIPYTQRMKQLGATME